MASVLDLAVTMGSMAKTGKTPGTSRSYATYFTARNRCALPLAVEKAPTDSTEATGNRGKMVRMEKTANCPPRTKSIKISTPFHSVWAQCIVGDLIAPNTWYPERLESRASPVVMVATADEVAQVVKEVKWRSIVKSVDNSSSIRLNRKMVAMERTENRGKALKVVWVDETDWTRPECLNRTTKTIRGSASLAHGKKPREIWRQNLY